MSNQPPAFQHYPKEYLSDINVQLMSMEEEGCYRRLMDYCWIEGNLPTDVETLTLLCKGTRPSQRVLSCFTLSDNRLIHKRLDIERKKQEEHREKQSRAGQKGNLKRWGKPKKPRKIIATPSHALSAP